MTTPPNPDWLANLSRRRFLQGAAGGAAYLASGSLLGRVAEAQAQSATCPGANVIANENRCSAAAQWTTGFKCDTIDASLRGYATKTSVNRGEPVSLKLISYRGTNPTSAQIRVYRLGYYGGKGARLVHTQNVAALPGFSQQGDGEYPAGNFGLRSFKGWQAFQTIPASATQISGMYLVKVVATSGAPGETQIPFIVRDDARVRDLLVAMPTNTWQAYNNWPEGSPTGKSLYPFNSSGPDTIVGSSRAAKVSFDRPYQNLFTEFNWVLRTEFPLIWWLERQGYDLSYTDDFGMHSQPDQLRAPKTKTLVLAGHAEYWTKEIRDNVEAARNAGTNIASFSANAGYWQVRYEDAGRTLVCFKTVQSRNVNTPDAGKDGVNDFGPGALTRGGSLDTLGADGKRGGSGADADRPGLATTTFRDPGASAGSSSAPDGVAPRQFEGRGRVGPNRPENALFGVLYIGDDDKVSYPMAVPPNSAGGTGEFGAHPAWRHTTLANGSGASIGRDLVGWEWDAIPASSGHYGRYRSFQPAGVKRLAQTVPPTNAPGQELEYLRDAGRVYSFDPDPAQGRAIHAVTYRASSGALVFSAGTMQWAWGLGPHFEAKDHPYTTYAAPPVDSYSICNGVIAQATHNILADGGVKPATPDGIVLDGTAAGPPASGAPRTTSRDSTPLAPARRSRRSSTQAK